MPTTVLIVDDDPENLTVLGELLRDRYRVRAANSGPRALLLAVQPPTPELILLDVMMPGMSGYEVLERLRDDPATRDVPVIFTTAMNATEDEQHGLMLGAVDYLTKPLRPAIVLARVQTHLELAQARARLRQDKVALESEVTRRIEENQLIQEATLRALARLAQARDSETGSHILRTQTYVQLLARRVRDLPTYAAELDDRRIELMAKSAALHDIGKVGIPDHVLLKPGRLDAAEWAVMKQHARIGADAILRAEADIRRPLEFLTYAKQIALHHHERWDGSGYPDGLAGEAIPLAARLMAVADVFDSLICPRVYKRAMGIDEARELMAGERGRHFDPGLLDAFLAHFEDFRQVAQRHAESP